MSRPYAVPDQHAQADCGGAAREALEERTSFELGERASAALAQEPRDYWFVTTTQWFVARMRARDRARKGE